MLSYCYFFFPSHTSELIFNWCIISVLWLTGWKGRLTPNYVFKQLAFMPEIVNINTMFVCRLKHYSCKFLLRNICSIRDERKKFSLWKARIKTQSEEMMRRNTDGPIGTWDCVWSQNRKGSGIADVFTDFTLLSMNKQDLMENIFLKVSFALVITWNSIIFKVILLRNFKNNSGLTEWSNSERRTNIMY